MHRAQIFWSPEHVRLGLPAVCETVDPAWLAGERPSEDSGWSLRCAFEHPPSEQGSPSLARVAYAMAEAPLRLAAGMQLQLFERATGGYARIEILE